MSRNSRLSRGESSVSYDNDWKKFCDWLGIYRERQSKIPSIKSRDVSNYMVISDLHIPFHNNLAITEAVEYGKKNNIDTLIIAGDTVDCYSLSRFTKFQTISIKEEYREARKFFDYASRNFNKVVVLSGNHELREKKYFSSRLTPDEMEWLLNKPMLQRCIEDIPNVFIHKNIIHNVDMNWFMEIGDVIIGHPEKSSSLHLKPVEQFRQWINMWGGALGFSSIPRLVIIGHTHQAGISWSGETMIIENGCLCKFQEYSLQANLYPKPQRLAFTTFSIKEGRVKVSSIKQFYPNADDYSKR
jgi:predicted phosphodiesterase